ncbi:MAG: enoyl-CoA hydratase [Ramlibacter sp.]|nr:enoyl-CoA hydratase [Ramlibacter sp.]
MNSSAPEVTIERQEATGIIRLSRPAANNALTLESKQLIAAAVTAFEQDTALRAILLCAEGENFCAGADLRALESRLDDPVALEDYLRVGLATYDRLAAARLPVVVAVQGLCLAGGLELMLACDIAFAADDARFGDQHARFGLFPGGGGTQRLPRLIGERRALDLMFSARWIDATTARDWGLVNEVVPRAELVQHALAYCAMLARRNPEALTGMKRCVREGAQLPLAEGPRLELATAVAVLRSSGARGGIAEFKARRKPAATAG